MADIAVRYAQALLTAARLENALPVVVEDMKVIEGGFAGLTDVFFTPVFHIRDQLETVDYVLGDNFHPLTKRFMRLLATMRRLGGICAIARDFIKLARKEMKQIDLRLTVFEETSPEQAATLVRHACGKGLFDAQYLDGICVQILVDKGLMGGFMMECEGTSWDCSLKARWSDMEKAIRKV